MDLCHFKNSELEPKFQKYNDRVVLREDVVKDDSGSYAVFTEQGSSASQMTAANVLDCAGQASHAVSAYAQVQMEDAPKLFKLSESDCPAIWIRSPRHRCKRLAENSRTRCSSREEFVRSSMSRIALGKTVRKGPGTKRMGESPGVESLQQEFLLFVYVDDIKMVWKKTIYNPCGKDGCNKLILKKRTQFLDQVYLGCTQRELKPNKKLFDAYKKFVRIFDLRRNY